MRHDHATGGPAFRLALALPTAFARTPAEVDALRRSCEALGLGSVAVEAPLLEHVLGAPAPTVPLDPPPADGLAFGLLELEEDVLRDSYELALGTFEAQRRAWRVQARLEAVAGIRRAWLDAGVALDILEAPDLVRWSDDEVGYACRLALAMGARVVSTTASLSGPSRLVPIARQHGVTISFAGDRSVGAAELERILELHQHATVAIDVDAWQAGGHGSPLPFVERHAARISHVRIGDAAWPMPGPNRPETAVHGLLRGARAGAWDFPVVIDVPRDDRDEWLDEATRALAWCRSVT